MLIVNYRGRTSSTTRVRLFARAPASGLLNLNATDALRLVEKSRLSVLITLRGSGNVYNLFYVRPRKPNCPPPGLLGVTSPN